MKKELIVTPKQLIIGLQLNENLDLAEDGTICKSHVLTLPDIIKIRKHIKRHVRVYFHANDNDGDYRLSSEAITFVNDLAIDCCEESIARIYNRERYLLLTEIVSELGTILTTKSLAYQTIQYVIKTDVYTCQHSINVACIMYMLNDILGKPVTPHDAVYAGILHDIGKTKVPIEILNKRGPLTIKERYEIQKHPETGYQMMKSEEFVNQTILDGIRYHHEKYDGSGYNKGLRDNKIPYIAQMLNVADVFDAITTDRPYHNAVDPITGLEKMTKMSKEFNPEIWTALKSTIERTHYQY